MRIRSLVIAASLSLLATSPARAQVRSTVVITLDGAKGIMAAAEAEAKKNNWNVSIAIVDVAGELIAFHRGDNTRPSNMEFSIAKARTAARFQRETRLIDSTVAAGRVQMLKADAFPVEGGVPVYANGVVIGAVGVSGATSAQDAQVARAGIAALRTTP